MVVRVNLLSHTNDYADLSGRFLPDTHRHNEGFTDQMKALLVIWASWNPVKLLHKIGHPGSTLRQLNSRAHLLR